MLMSEVRGADVMGSYVSFQKSPITDPPDREAGMFSCFVRCAKR
jgi:hypothetical protein